MQNPFLRFHVRMAHHALLQFAASLRSSLEIITLAFAPVLLGLLAFLALPGLYAATQPWPQATGLLMAQSLLACLPVWLLRKRLLPAEVVAWTRPWPVPPHWRWGAHALVAGMIVGPLALAYAISATIWLYQWPDWLRPVAPQALLLTVASLLLAWGGSAWILARRSHAPARPKRGRRRPAASSYRARPRRPGYLWRQLFWLPFWRAENKVGWQQSLLLLGALASVTAWLWHPAALPAPALGAAASLFLILLTDRGDKAVAEQIALLQPVAAAWPLNTARLFRLAILFSLAPGLCLLAWFAWLTLGHAGPAGFSRTVALVWLAVAGLATSAIVALRRLSPRGRVSLVMGAILILTAIGSELWN